MHASMISRFTSLGSTAILVVIGFGCTPSRPKLERYSNHDIFHSVIVESEGEWTIAPDGDLLGTIDLLEASSDPIVVEHARSVRSGATEQRIERERAVKSLLEEDLDLVDLMHETGRVGTMSEVAFLGDGDLPRSELLDEYRKAEEQGRIGDAIRTAAALRSMESMIDSEAITTHHPDSLKLLRRNQDRMKLIRLLDPDLADRLMDPQGTDRERSEVESKWPIRSDEDLDDLRRNTTRVIDLLKTEHVSDPDLKSLHTAGINEVIFMCSVLRNNEWPVPLEYTERLVSIRDSAGGDTRRLLADLNRSERELAGDSLPRGFSLRVFGDGAASSLDKQTSVILPDEFEQYTRSMSSEYRGIGSRIILDDDGQVVLNPTHGSPARKAGARDGDVVLGIDGIGIEHFSIEDLSRIATEPGRDRLTLLVRHEDGVEEELSIVIGSVVLPQVTGWSQAGLTADQEPTWCWLADRQERIAYLKPDGFRFGGDTMIRLALQEAQEEAREHGGRLEGMILDLRGNPGGHVYVAVEMCNLFMRVGKAFQSRGRDGLGLGATVSTRYGELEGMPLIILVDDQSASASELVSGVLGRSDDVLVIGERTYGKGSVQSIHPCATRDCLARITSAWYMVPDRSRSSVTGSWGWRFIDRDVAPDSWGITPDLVLPVSTEESDQVNSMRSAWYTGEGKDQPDVGDRVADPTVCMALALLRERVRTDAEQVEEESQ